MTELPPDKQAAIVEALHSFGESIVDLALEKSGVLSNIEIRQALVSGQILIHPFRSENINTSSYDVTLGEHFYRTDRSSHNVFFNPFDQVDVSRYFGQEPLTAIEHAQWAHDHNRDPFKHIPLDHKIVVLAPGERILAHTHEFIGIGPPGTSSMQARSTWGRIGIQVCEDAGWGDSGYKNRWTMEIHNGNENVHVPLPVGERVGQMVFFHTGPVEGDYARAAGKYQEFHEEFTDMFKAWTPLAMLPRAYKDTRMKPLPL